MVGDEMDEINSGVNTRTIVFDFSDLDNPVYHSQYAGGNAAIDHNLYVKGDLVFEANYTSGLRVLDISDINNITEVGYFDTYPENNNTNFNGAWSVFPYFDSGNIIISDINRGLFVVRKSGTLSVDDSIFNNKEVMIYPNPAQEEITLFWPGPKNYSSIQILDLNGKLVKNEKATSSPQRISTYHLKNGIYFIYLSNTNGNSKVSKLTIQH